MATVIDYADVLKRAGELGLVSAYFNTGAFAYPPGERVKVVGWTAGEDPTIRPGLATVAVGPPFAANLAKRLGDFWPNVIDGDLWLMPKSHWAFELDHANGPWLAPALAAVGVDPEILRPRTDGAAVAFAPEDQTVFPLVERLLTELKASDFAILFPRHRHLVTVHHHCQLWWQTPDAKLAQKLKKPG